MTIKDGSLSLQNNRVRISYERKSEAPQLLKACHHNIKVKGFWLVTCYLVDHHDDDDDDDDDDHDDHDDLLDS